MNIMVFCRTSAVTLASLLMTACLLTVCLPPACQAAPHFLDSQNLVVYQKCRQCRSSYVAPRTVTEAVVCSACGEMFGAEFGHCCLCSPSVFSMCAQARRR